MFTVCPASAGFAVRLSVRIIVGECCQGYCQSWSSPSTSGGVLPPYLPQQDKQAKPMSACVGCVATLLVVLGMLLVPPGHPCICCQPHSLCNTSGQLLCIHCIARNLSLAEVEFLCKRQSSPQMRLQSMATPVNMLTSQQARTFWWHDVLDSVSHSLRA